jgi:hypothetical protein
LTAGQLCRCTALPDLFRSFFVICQKESAFHCVATLCRSLNSRARAQTDGCCLVLANAATHTRATQLLRRTTLHNMLAVNKHVSLMRWLVTCRAVDSCQPP